MRQVGRRRQPDEAQAGAEQGLHDAERITATAIALAQGRCALPKGLRRFKTHEAANEWQARQLAAFMSELARRRRHG